MKKIILFCLTFSTLLINSQNKIWEKPFIGSDKNLLYLPDANAIYWRYGWSQEESENMGIEIKGQFPDARYFSFNIYNDDTKSTLGSIIDIKIEPDNPKSNQYTIYFVPEGTSINKKNVIFFPRNIDNLSILLRYYLPNKNIMGGKNLPSIKRYNLTTKKTEKAKESISASSFTGKDIAKHLKPFLRKILESTQEELVVKWLNYQNNPLNIEELICKQLTSKAFELNMDSKKMYSYNLNSQGTYPNNDNHYLTMPITKEEDKVYLIRFKMPKYAKSKNDNSNTDVRYFSISQGDDITYNYKTVADKDFLVSKEDSMIYLIISDEDNEIKEYVKKNKINYMPWLVKNKMLLIYRNMLPNESFNYGAHKVPLYNPNKDEKQDATTFIKEYAPIGIKINKSAILKTKELSEFFK